MYKRRQRLKNKPTNIDVLIWKFHRTVCGGPIYVCANCQQLWYRHSVSNFDTAFSKESTKRITSIIDHGPRTTSIENKIWICNTCKSHIKKGKIPPTSVMNQMTFPDQGILKYLNPLELTLVSVLLPFMKIHQEPRGRQTFIQGNMVIVPANVCQTVTQLPRLTSETSTMKATLKRRLKYKHHIYCLNIRPEMVLHAAKPLSESPLYKEHNVVFDNDWENLENKSK